MLRPFQQVDVFTHTAFRGNPVAVVLGAEGLAPAAMQRVAHWTNLSETTFVLAPTTPEAHYRLRIFTPSRELPFAGHPTLGSAHAWLGRVAPGSEPDVIVQECAGGLVRIRRTEHGLAFAAPELIRSGPVEDKLIRHVATLLGIDPDEIEDAQWVDNGPGWIGVLLQSADAVLALRPEAVDLDVVVIGPYPEGSEATFEVRAFFPAGRTTVEDPVTGSLNASLGQWLLGSGRVAGPYVVSQGTALGRAGRVYVSDDANGTVWVAGGTVTCVSGHIDC